MYTPVHRPPRLTGPAAPHGEIMLEPPPELPEATGGGAAQALMMLPMLVGGAAMSLMMVGPGGGSPITYLTSGMYGLSMFGMMGMSMGQGGGGNQRQKIDAGRRDYMRQLARNRRQVAKVVSAQRAAATWSFPAPQTLWSLAASRRLWERRATDPDFGHARVALGTHRLAARLVPPEAKPAEDLEPLCAAALYRFITTHSTVSDIPVALSLRSFPRLVVEGDDEHRVGLARAVIAHMATFHAPDDLCVAVCAAPDRLAEWEWLKWLPHATHPARTDAAGPLRLVATDLGELERAFGDDLASRPRFSPDGAPLAEQRHLLVVVDAGAVPSESQLAAGPIHGVTALDLTGSLPAGEAATLRVEADQLTLVTREDGTPTETKLGVPDSLDRACAAALASQLTSFRIDVETERPEATAAGAISLNGLLGVADPGQLDPAVTWRPRASRDRLRIPVGVGPDGQPVDLDLKEAAQGGMGPHGIVIGATGSGKSELLRSLVLGLAVTHSSQDLNLVLVDFKGGATFLGLDRLPHTSAIITNLSDELPLVDRMQFALHGELIRRQELLRASGHQSRRDYERARELGAALDPLPSLLIIVDEFSELLANKPEFAELFVMIGRLGRSLGVHLLLASQHMDEGRMRGLGVHLSFRIALRTFSAGESRAVLGVADAYELPSAPGHAYLLYDNTKLVRFRAGYVSGAYRPAASLAPDAPGRPHQSVVDFGIAPLSMPDEPDPATDKPDEPDEQIEAAAGSERSVLDVIVDRLTGQGPPAHRVWLPPLDAPPSLDALLAEVDASAALGHLRVPVGIVDRPFEQRRDPLVVELDGSAGNVAVVGKPQSGKSNAIRTLIAALALTHTPDQVRFYCLDFGGGSLRQLADLPHVGGVAGRQDTELVRRTIAELNATLEQRERDFAARALASMEDARRRAGTDFPDVFLVVDGWQVLQQDFDGLDQTVTKIVSRGLAYGVHVVLSANRWMDVRPAVRDMVGSRLELRLGEPFESEIDRRAAANVPENAPGRGVTKDSLHFLCALPRIDDRARTTDLSRATAGLVAAVRQRWTGRDAPKVRMLPKAIPLASLPPSTADGLPIGLDEDALQPVLLNFDAEPHLIILGEAESGRTNLLRVIADGVVSRFTPVEARILMVDYRRTMLDAVPASHLIGYAASPDALRQMVNDVAEAMRDRLPGPDLTTEQLRSRSWWSGAQLFILVDDYDLVESAQGSPLAPLSDLFAQGADIGLHLVVAREVGGAGRAMFEQVLRRVREIGSPGLQLSGSPDEGTIFGKVRPQPMPPGRGILVSRRLGTRTIQTALAPDEQAAPLEPAGRP